MNPGAASHTLDLTLSPYHLTTADPPALASLLLGSHIYTMMPTPFAFAGGEQGREQVRRAVEKSPGYLRLMEAWRWAVPLWQAGVVRSMLGRPGEGPDEISEEVHRIWARLTLPTDESSKGADPLAPLRAVMRPTLYRDEREYLDRFCADILKGGPDPGISICIAAGLDALAVRHGFTAVRAGLPTRGGTLDPTCGAPGGSVWQRAEAALCQRVFAVGIPVLLRASGRRILHARERLAPELEALRVAISEAAAAAGDCDAAGPDPERLTQAAADYTRAFAQCRRDVAGGDDDQGVRVQDGFVSLTGVVMPADAALRSSLTAVRSLGARTGFRAQPAARVADDERLDGPAGTTLFALVIKRMNIRPETDAQDAQAHAAASPSRRS